MYLQMWYVKKEKADLHYITAENNVNYDSWTKWKPGLTAKQRRNGDYAVMHCGGVFFKFRISRAFGKKL